MKEDVTDSITEVLLFAGQLFKDIKIPHITAGIS